MKPGTSYVIGYEPHSALPVGIPSVFSTPSPRLPKFLARSNFHSLASGVCFLVPFVRQLWWWLVRQWGDHISLFPPSRLPCLSASAPSAVPLSAVALLVSDHSIPLFTQCVHGNPAVPVAGAACWVGEIPTHVCPRESYAHTPPLTKGLRPATKEVMEGILGSGGSVLLCPGGVQARAAGGKSHS